MTEEARNIKKILVAEDDQASAELLRKILEKAGYLVEVVSNGKNAYIALMKNKYDILLTDWMMPQMDGIELIRKVRDYINDPPVIAVVTALSSQDARNHALNSGADEFFTKPYRATEIVKKLDDLFHRITQKPSSFVYQPSILPEKNPSFSGICIAASSGGPQTIKQLLSLLPVIDDAAIFIIQHGPQWALLDMVDHLNKISSMEVVLGSNGIKVEPGKIFLAPGNYHMIIEPGSLSLKLNDDPPENFIKPAADPLFRSVARSFGKSSIAVVLSGMGCDGTLGSQYISSVGGIVIAQDPATAVVRFMPTAVIESVPGALVIPLQEIPNAIVKYTKEQLIV